MSHAEWNALVGQLRANLEEEDFELWISPLKPRFDSADCLQLECPSTFHLNWVRDNHLASMRKLMRQMGMPAKVTLKTPTAKLPGVSAKTPRQLSLPTLEGPLPFLNKKFVFESFVTGRSNEFACAATKALADHQSLPTNTLFLVSDTGLGKSHLTQAVGHRVMAIQPKSTVAYLTAEDFANQMVGALRHKRIEEFKARFRKYCDVLLLEEVQFLANKNKIQDELGYTLDSLLNAGKRVIFTSSLAPNKIKGFKKGLMSRLSSGITVPIDPPDHATRVRILERLADEHDVEVPQDIMEFLAQEVTTDVRRLKSSLVALVARASLTNRPMNLSLASEVVDRMETRLQRVTPTQIMSTVAKVYGVEQEVLTGRSRRKAVTRPRNLAMFLCRRHTDESYAGIGKVFNRDHATVMYGVGQVERKLNNDSKLAQELSYLEKKLGLEK